MFLFYVEIWGRNRLWKRGSNVIHSHDVVIVQIPSLSHCKGPVHPTTPAWSQAWTHETSFHQTVSETQEFYYYAFHGLGVVWIVESTHSDSFSNSQNSLTEIQKNLEEVELWRAGRRFLRQPHLGALPRERLRGGGLGSTMGEQEQRLGDGQWQGEQLSRV